MATRQSYTFLDGEGDAWYSRNAATLATRDPFTDDPVIELLERYQIKPARVLEVGCSNGWRLHALAERYGSWCWGVDPSEDACNAGRNAAKRIYINRGTAEDVTRWAHVGFDLVIGGFCLYLIDRERLLHSVAAIDDALAGGGWLLLHDFAPDRPTKVPYKHRQGLWTYKLPDAGAALWLATARYQLLAQVYCDHDSLTRHGMGIPSERRTAVVLLRKVDMYS